MENKKLKWRFTYHISGPLQDPFLLVEFSNEGHVLLFDCGVRVWGRVKTILKVRHLFITHAHIDHLIGFDHIVRALLGEEKHLKIYGPKGIRNRLASKLGGYDWDRAADQALVLEIHELHGSTRTVQIHRCRDRFELKEPPHSEPWDGVVVDEPIYRVRAAQMDHGGSPCLAYVLEEKDYLKIDKKKLSEMQWTPGPWVGRLLKWIEAGRPGDIVLTVNGTEFTATDLERNLVRKVNGHKIAYVTDTVFSDSVRSNLQGLIRGSDVLFCESTFLPEDEHLAVQYHHLTSAQAARIAADNNVQKLVLFHVSNRYFPKLFRLVVEARKIFPDTELAPNPGRPRRSNRVQKRFHDSR